MEPQVFNRNELGSTFPLRPDVERAHTTLMQLLADEDVMVASRFQPVGHHEYRGTVRVRGQQIRLAFHHKGQGGAYRLSALRAEAGTSPDIVRLLRQVISRNAQNPDLGVSAARPPFEQQPDVMGIRGSSSGTSSKAASRPYHETKGFLAEQHFVQFLDREAPDLPYEWLNAQREQGQPYDVLVQGRLAIDVKGTTFERDHISLTENELRFRAQHTRHHAVALVTLTDDAQASPKAIDLYVGDPLRKSPLQVVRQWLTSLPILERFGAQQAPKRATQLTAAAEADREGASPYFLPGTYHRVGDEAGTLSLEPGGGWHRSQRGETAGGRYCLQGNRVMLSDGSAFHIKRRPGIWSLTDQDAAVWQLVEDA